MTERQLQDWRRHGWAEHMFRDRARTRRLLFVGFGSEDPMVRHTVMQVSEEFGEDHQRDGGARSQHDCHAPQEESTVDRAPGEDGSPPPCDCAPCPIENAPFFSEYGQLRPTQRQVLAGFCLGQSCGRSLRASALRDGLETGIRANACAADYGDGHTADDFWRGIYVRSIRRLWQERYFSNDSPLARYLAPLLHSADSLLAAVRQALTSEAAEGFWGTLPPYLELDDTGRSGLSQVHLAAAGGHRAAAASA